MSNEAIKYQSLINVYNNKNIYKINIIQINLKLKYLKIE